MSAVQTSISPTRCSRDALNVTSYMGGNGELLRQLHITRTQLQTADLWAANAACQVPAATEGE
jgi:hypothetical protein